MTWHIWTDGSCVAEQHGQRKHTTPKGGVGYGGWAAIVEHGSEGFVLRGRVAETTNVQMELLAVIEGLSVVPDGDDATVHTDSTVILAVLDRWQRGTLGSESGRREPAHVGLWRRLGREFDRLHVRVALVTRGPRDPVHRRAHGFAGAEAKAAFQIATGRLPQKATPLLEDDRRILGDRFKREVRAWRNRHERVNAKSLPSSR